VSEALLERLPRAVRPLADPPGPRGWNYAELSDLLPAGARTSAAVLVPIVNRAGTLSVLLTRRTDHLTRHAGQVSFPGGRVEPDDADVIAAALRETQEEIGVAAALLEPFGYLDCLETVSGYCVTPVVAWLEPSYHAQPDPSEVAEVFEVPLALFLAAENLRRTHIQFQGRAREVLEYVHAGPRIWGATAMMLMNLVKRLEDTP
jgi:8-oxo-dGTP pyrophosphatase MutT (NUDIX family)